MSVEDARAKALDRWRKLVALAEDQKGRPEGAAAMRLASKLFERWLFTTAEINTVSDASFGTPSAQVDLFGSEAERYREHYRALLLAVVAEMADCKVAYNPETWKGSVYGNPEAAAEIAAIYAEISETLGVSFHRWWEHQGNKWGRTKRAVAAKQWWHRCMVDLQDLGAGPTIGVPSDSVSLMLAQVTRLSGGVYGDDHVSSRALRAVRGLPDAIVGRFRALKRFRMAS